MDEVLDAGYLVARFKPAQRILPDGERFRKHNLGEPESLPDGANGSADRVLVVTPRIVIGEL